MHRLNGILMETIQGWSLAPGEMRTAVWLGLVFRSQAGDVFFLQGNLRVVIKQKDGAAGVQGWCGGWCARNAGRPPSSSHLWYH